MSFKKILSGVAPFIGTLIGGPFGAAAGKAIGSLLCDNPNASEDEMQEALTRATPEQLVAIRKLDTDYKMKMAEIGLSEKKLAALDRDSARKREATVKDFIPGTLAIALTLGFFAVLFFMMSYPIRSGIQNVIDVMLGSLGTAWIACITYYFGSSNDVQKHYKS